MRYPEKHIQKLLSLGLIIFLNSCSLIPFYLSEPQSAKETGKNGVVIIGEVRIKDSTGASFVNDIFRESLQYVLLKEGYSPIVIDEEMRETTSLKNFGFIQIEADSKEKLKTNDTSNEVQSDPSIKLIGKTDKELKALQEKLKFDYYLDSTVILKEVGSVLDGKNSLLIYIRAYDKTGRRIGAVEYITVGPKDKLDRVISEGVKEISKKWKVLTQ
ncbi:lipoprotein [Leptospira sp. 201903071]|uniref:lipoprotein n=1 Tax=Leptospira ainazelensis TaxID=2810034 RepID=UPI001963904F|nr:lipoprotein [Leptospira ainazelensis]MBM9502910.1 lipoprotein [Leptospira ainazelensis]